MDDQWETEVIEYGAINITGFRIVDNSRRYVREFLENWRRLDNKTSPGAGRESISVGWIIGKKNEDTLLKCIIIFLKTKLYSIISNQSYPNLSHIQTKKNVSRHLLP